VGFNEEGTAEEIRGAFVKIIIDISEYDKEWIANGYSIPQELNADIARKIIEAEPLFPDDNTSVEDGKSVVYAHWIGDPVPEGNANIFTSKYVSRTCSHCGYSLDVMKELTWNYCPNCGAKMGEKD